MVLLHRSISVLPYFLMLTISFFVVVLQVALQSAVLVIQRRILGPVINFSKSALAALTLNAGLGDPDDDQAGRRPDIDLPRVFTGWSNAVEDTYSRCQREWS